MIDDLGKEKENECSIEDDESRKIIFHFLFLGYLTKHMTLGGMKVTYTFSLSAIFDGIWTMVGAQSRR